MQYTYKTSLDFLSLPEWRYAFGRVGYSMEMRQTALDIAGIATHTAGCATRTKLAFALRRPFGASLASKQTIES